MANLKLVEISDIQSKKSYIVQKTEDEYQTAEEAEMLILGGDEIIEELDDVFGTEEGDSTEEKLIRFGQYVSEVDWTYRVFEIPGVEY